VVYMMFDDELYAWFREYTHLDCVPMNEFGLSPRSAKNLPVDLATAASPATRRYFWELVRRSLTVGEDSVNAVLDTIARDLRAADRAEDVNSGHVHR